MISRVSLLVSCVALFAAVSGVNAQNFPAEGPLSVSFTATQIPPAKPMAIGPGKEFVVLNMAMTGVKRYRQSGSAQDGRALPVCPNRRYFDQDHRTARFLHLR